MILAKELAAFLIRLSGIPWLTREWFGRHKVSILLYQNPAPETMDRHLTYLSKNHHFITLNRAVDAISTNDFKQITPKSLVLTLDDGYAANERLLDHFKAHGVKPTIYLSSHIIDTAKHFPVRKNRDRQALNRRKIKRQKDKTLLFREYQAKMVNFVTVSDVAQHIETPIKRPP